MRPRAHTAPNVLHGYYTVMSNDAHSLSWPICVASTYRNTGLNGDERTGYGVAVGPDTDAVLGTGLTMVEGRFFLLTIT